MRNNRLHISLLLGCGVLLATAFTANAAGNDPFQPQPQLPVVAVAQEGGGDVAAQNMPSVIPMMPANNARMPMQPGFPPAPAGKHTLGQPQPKEGGARSLVGMFGQGEEHGAKYSSGMILDPPATVLPEVTTTVKLSSSDVNRIICSDGEISDAITSDEKGLMIKTTGRDTFVKFKIAKRADGKLSYSSTPTELYVVCGGQTYSLIAFPSRLPSQTIRLSTGIESKVKANQALYAGLPFEKRIMRAIKEVYTDNIPETYTVKRYSDIDMKWQGLVIALQKTVDIDGEGMLVKEYRISLKDGRSEPFRLDEKLFLRREFTSNPIAVSIDKHVLRPGDTARLFIVEQRPDRPLGGNGFNQLPVMESGDSIAAKPEESSESQQGKLPVPHLSRGGVSNYNMAAGGR